MIRAALLAAFLAAPAAAQTLDAVPRPEPRAAPPATAADMVSVPRPETRPARQPARTGGGICGDPAISGTAIERIPGRIEGCGIDSPVRVQAIAGVRLNRPARMDCTTATAIKTWLQRGVLPVLPDLTALDVAAGYSCRTINNRPDADISEHGKGRAIDISAFQRASGERLTVLEGWRDRRTRRQLRRIHQAACGPFSTVLGPEADRYHQDHFHLDTARRGGGAYCR